MSSHAAQRSVSTPIVAVWTTLTREVSWSQQGGILSGPFVCLLGVDRYGFFLGAIPIFFISLRRWPTTPIFLSRCLEPILLLLPFTSKK